MENLTLHNFAHFCFYYPHNFIDVAFKGNQHFGHIKSKFEACYNKVGSKAVIPTFYHELDRENQKTLSKYVSSIYLKKQSL